MLTARVLMTCRQLVLRCLHLLSVEWAEDLLHEKLRFLLPLAYNIASNKNAAGMELVRSFFLVFFRGCASFCRSPTTSRATKTWREWSWCVAWLLVSAVGVWLI